MPQHTMIYNRFSVVAAAAVASSWFTVFAVAVAVYIQMYTHITHATYIYVCVDEQRVFYVWSPSLCHPAFHRASIRRPFLFCFWNQNKNTTQSTVSVTIRLRTWMHYKYTFLLVLRMFCCFSVMWLDTLSLSMVPLPNTILEVDCGLE